MDGLRRIFSNNGEILSVKRLSSTMIINPAAKHLKNLFIKYLLQRGRFLTLSTLYHFLTRGKGYRVYSGSGGKCR
jgi:hypothetical protein